ncbi:endonuclease/exonuclease/phosphatase family protein [Niabella insulamsoli]|uniref:endonuclease/exonuclease/phosphatase family protein n=1 Tax=Niabella insulamsoli TaxID=3144874 RepID=UPI0031FD1B2D
MGIFARISNRVLFVVNAVVVAAFLLACLNPYISPENWPLFALISLAFPFLAVLVIAFLVWWLFAFRKWALLSAIALILGSGQIFNFFAVSLNSSFEEQPKEKVLRVATWNVARFIEMVKNNNMGSQTRYKMLKQIGRANADILCFQEFSSSISPDWYNNIVAVGKGLKYPYHYFSHDVDGDKLFNGSVIFSRFPIVDTGMVRFPRPSLPDALVFADINVDGKLVRVHTAHLQSNQFRKEDRSKIEELKDGKGNWINNAGRILSKLSVAIRYRSIQADVVKTVISSSPNPVIFCGDLNDVPNSYTYRTIKGDMSDAFLRKGFGIGRTYTSLSPTLRIDYIFADHHFEIQQCKRITTRYSDHYMVVADLKLANR